MGSFKSSLYVNGIRKFHSILTFDGSENLAVFMEHVIMICNSADMMERK